MSKVVVELVVTGLFAFVYGGDDGNGGGPQWLEILAPKAGAVHHRAEVSLLEKGAVEEMKETLEGVQLHLEPAQEAAQQIRIDRQRKAECPRTTSEGSPEQETDEATRLDWTVEMDCLDHETKGVVPNSIREDSTGKIVSTRLRLPPVPLEIRTGTLSQSTLFGKSTPILTRFAPFSDLKDLRSIQVTADKMIVRFEMEVAAGQPLMLRGVDITKPQTQKFARALELPASGPVRLTLSNETGVDASCGKPTLDGLCTMTSRGHFDHYYTLLKPTSGKRPTLFPGIDPEGVLHETVWNFLGEEFKTLYAGGGRPICMMSSFVAEK